MSAPIPTRDLYAIFGHEPPPHEDLGSGAILIFAALWLRENIFPIALGIVFGCVLMLSTLYALAWAVGTWA